MALPSAQPLVALHRVFVSSFRSTWKKTHVGPSPWPPSPSLTPALPHASHTGLASGPKHIGCSLRLNCWSQDSLTGFTSPCGQFPYHIYCPPSPARRQAPKGGGPVLRPQLPALGLSIHQRTKQLLRKLKGKAGVVPKQGPLEKEVASSLSLYEVSYWGC